MNRLTKNIICIVVIILGVTGIYFTMDYMKNNNTNDKEMNSQMMQAPSKPDGDMGGESVNENENNNVNNNEDSDEANKPSGNMGESRKPGDMNGQPNSENGNFNESNKPGNIPSMNNSFSSIDVKYYVIFATLGLIISCSVIYLIMSSFNKYGFKEVFINKDKYLIYILGSIVLCSIITYSSSYVYSKCFVSNNSNINNNASSSGNIKYSSSNTISSDVDGGEYSSSNADENVFLVTDDISISNVSVSKTGDSDGGDNTSFYGINSAITAKDGAKLNIENAVITTDATGSNGVFSYGGSAQTNNTSSDGTTVNISNSTITTTKDNSGGIMTTGGGVMNASNLTITTSGISSAAIRSDRGGGEVNVKGGTYTTNGQGSPSIYSTANISVSDASLVSNASEGIVIEGANSVTLDNCVLTDNNTLLNGKSTTYKNIFLYQSMSGDAASGNSEFTSKNSKIITNKGDTFYITNTSSTINLSNNEIINNDSTGNFLRAKSDSWGNVGSNGADVILNLDNQEVSGNIVIDSISTLTLNMTSSYYEGEINKDNTAKSISITLDSDSHIKLTGDSYIMSLSNADSNNSNIDFNGYKLYVNGESIN